MEQLGLAAQTKAVVADANSFSETIAGKAIMWNFQRGLPYKAVLKQRKQGKGIIDLV